jgi:BTB/POZ domain
MAAVVVVCHGVRLHVARDVLRRAPLLLNACSDEPQEAEEEVTLDRDPAAVRMVLEYCKTGIINQQMLTEIFFAEADYFGVAPLRPLLQPAREAETYEQLWFSVSIFVERLINTNIMRSGHDSDFAQGPKQGSIDPTFTLLVKCERYEPCDIWSRFTDAYRHVVAHPGT